MSFWRLRTGTIRVRETTPTENTGTSSKKVESTTLHRKKLCYAKEVDDMLRKKDELKQQRTKQVIRKKEQGVLKE